MSQLGYMMIAIGMSEYELSIYHVINHAYYKALLFLSVGVIIHTMNDEQFVLISPNPGQFLKLKIQRVR